MSLLLRHKVGYMDLVPKQPPDKIPENIYDYWINDSYLLELLGRYLRLSVLEERRRFAIRFLGSQSFRKNVRLMGIVSRAECAPWSVRVRAH